MENNNVECTYVQHLLLHLVNTRLELNSCLFVLNDMYITHSLAACQGNVIYQMNIFIVMSPCSCTNTVIKFVNQNQHMY